MNTTHNIEDTNLGVNAPSVQEGCEREIDVVVRRGSVNPQDDSGTDQSPWSCLESGMKGGGLRVDPMPS